MGQLTEPTVNEVLADRQTTHLQMRYATWSMSQNCAFCAGVHGSSGGIAGRAESAFCEAFVELLVTVCGRGCSTGVTAGPMRRPCELGRFACGTPEAPQNPHNSTPCRRPPTGIPQTKRDFAAYPGTVVRWSQITADQR